MRTISLDVHADYCQMAVLNKDAEVVLEMQVPTTREDIRRVIGGIPGPKHVVFEEGSLSGLIYDAVKDLVDEITSTDPTRNALISRSENKNDENDAVSLGLLTLNKSIRKIFVPEEPHRTLRSLLSYDNSLQASVVRVNNAMKALCRRWGIKCRGRGIRRRERRRELARELPNATLRWQLEGLGRQMDLLRLERTRVCRHRARITRSMSAVAQLKTIPGVGPIVAPTIVAWVVDPHRFRSRSALAAYAGIGIGGRVSDWKPTRRPRAMKRGNRQLKRVLFIGAEAAIKGANALAKRYQARIAAGWDHRKARRDIARHILFIACAIMNHGGEYDDGRVIVPDGVTSNR